MVYIPTTALRITKIFNCSNCAIVIKSYACGTAVCRIAHRTGRANIHKHN